MKSHSGAMKCVAAAVAALGALGVCAEVMPSGIFTSNMVLPRETAVEVWGSADAGEAVTVAFAGQSVSTKADEKGKWSARLAAMPVSRTGRTMTVTGKNSVSFENILVGDVWLCSGQSNMEMSYHDDNRLLAPLLPEAADYPEIRQLKIHRDLLDASHPDGVNAAHPWTVCGTETVKDCSLAAYFFARKLVRETGIPIGIVEAAVGGERIEPFMAPYRGGFRRYDYMIHPLVRFAFKGVIWYQGCSNVNDGEDYRFKLTQLAAGWRTAFGLPTMPFYYMQLSTWNSGFGNPVGGGDPLARLREAQRMALTMIPEPVGMGVAVDVGSHGDIHPHDKYDVGERLANWALNKTYGQKEVAVSGPLYKSIAIEGGKARLSFDCADGLKAAIKSGVDAPVTVATGSVAAQFSIAGSDGVWHFADAVEFDNGDVLVSSASVAAPVAVRYAYRSCPDNLPFVYNSANLPMVPFRTDYDEDDFGAPPKWTPKTGIMPEIVTNLVYTGAKQAGIVGRDGYALSGAFAATAAGDYTATVTLKEGYQWKDRLKSASRQVRWTIAKGRPAIGGLLVMPIWREGERPSEPHGLTSDLGAVEYVYYADAAATTPLGVRPTAAGTYYVRGEVKATADFDGAVSSCRRFRILAPGACDCQAVESVMATRQQKLLTDYIANPRTWMKLDVRFSGDFDPTKGGSVFAAAGGDNDASYRIHFGGRVQWRNLLFLLLDQTWNANTRPYAPQREFKEETLKSRNTLVVCNGERKCRIQYGKELCDSVVPRKTTTASRPLVLLGDEKSCFGAYDLELYSWRIYESDDGTANGPNQLLIHDLVPAKDKNGKAGLFDLVTGDFLTSVTGTDLVAGAETGRFR